MLVLVSSKTSPSSRCCIFHYTLRVHSNLVQFNQSSIMYVQRSIQIHEQFLIKVLIELPTIPYDVD